jgi:hypothetical protein
LNCPKTAGFINGPFVPTESVAREIYKVMLPSLAPLNVEKYPSIIVKDEGDHWWVSQEASRPEPGYGGGQLYMNIDKCTGAISRAAFNR